MSQYNKQSDIQYVRFQILSVDLILDCFGQLVSPPCIVDVSTSIDCVSVSVNNVVTWCIIGIKCLKGFTQQVVHALDSHVCQCVKILIELNVLKRYDLHKYIHIHTIY